MPKIRVHQLAKELNISNEKVIEYLTKKNVKVKNHFAALDEDTVAIVKKMIEKESQRSKARAVKPSKDEKKAEKELKEKVEEKNGEEVAEVVEEEAVPREKVEIHEGASVKDFAEAIGKSPNDLIKMMIALGEMVTINQPISHEAIDVLADELHLEVEILTVEEEEEEIVDDEASLKPRPPVVTVMGHVDHGKTLLLDAIRETDVVGGEAGGITQHIGAYQVDHGGKPVTFIDTPGHEAFTAMRARGASVTDIAVLVVAADDSVMPQTVEAIDHARAAGVPIVVAINKVDKPEANLDKVRQELSEYQLIPEDWGGETVFVETSAKQQTNIKELVDMVILVADIRELKANPDALASGVAVEARLDKGRGPVASVLIQRGTLRVGDPIVIGKVFGKVRAMLDDKGKHVKEALPSRPVEILGLSSVPAPGDKLRAYEEEKMARQVAEEREIKARLAKHARARVSLDDLFERIKEGEIQDLNIVVKGDTQGSVEAVRESLEKIDQEEVKINVIHKGTGAISESDVMLAAASNAIIIGFSVRPTIGAKDMAEKEKVDIRTYRIIYKVIEDIKAARVGMLAPQYEEKDVGYVEIRETFKVPKIGIIAGCYVSQGEVSRDALARLVREGTVVYEGKVSSLRRFKDDVKNVKEGFECGISLENFQDIKVGDVVEIYEMIEIPQEG